jgi:hypothetical protein
MNYGLVWVSVPPVIMLSQLRPKKLFLEINFVNKPDVTPAEDSAGSLIAFCTVTFPVFSRIPFQPYMLPNHTPRPNFNAISHE